MEQLNVCTVYAIINEEAVSMSETLCGGTTRQKVVYTSVSSSVTVRIVGKGKSGHFLLRYEGVCVYVCVRAVRATGVARAACVRVLIKSSVIVNGMATDRVVKRKCYSYKG